MTAYKGYIFLYDKKFKNEFKKILKNKKCPTLNTDFKLLYDVLIQSLNESNTLPTYLCHRISGLDSCVTLPAFIIKKFRCEGINKGSRSGFRITFLFDKEESKFIFVEIFIKSKKNNPNLDYINSLFNNKDVNVVSELYNDEQKFLN